MTFFTHTLDMIPNGVAIVDLDHRQATLSNKEIDNIFGLQQSTPAKDKLNALQNTMKKYFIYDQRPQEEKKNDHLIKGPDNLE